MKKRAKVQKKAKTTHIFSIFAASKEINSKRKTTTMYLIIFIVLMVLSFIVSKTLNARIEKYSKIRLSSGLTGKEIAEKMLRDNGIYDVQVTSVAGTLTDHYNP